jgi:hypothetical protein
MSTTSQTGLLGGANKGARRDVLADAFLPICMGTHRVDQSELAQACGVSPRFFVNQKKRGFSDRKLRWAIEHHLHFSSLWSSSPEVEARRRCFQRYGVDPRLASLPDLRAFCKRLGIKSTIRQREAWYGSLEAWLAVHCLDQNTTRKIEHERISSEV